MDEQVMKPLGIQQKWIFSFTVLVILLYSACSLDSPAITQASTHKQDVDYEPFYTATSSFNDIESIRVVCYLHLKTVQVQIDINYVGSSDLLVEKTRTSTVFEQILIRNSIIRNVQVIESSSTQLEHSEIILENGTLIQFVLSSTIPVGVQRNVKITYLQDTTELTSSYSYYLGVDWLRRIGSHH
ncbi:MAG: hypothetical protein ACTSSH_04520, partial [Candidatus Heimdallarchaeota archaeon]